MLGESASLEDGTAGTVLTLTSPAVTNKGSSLGPIIAAAVGDNVWTLRLRGTFVTIRNALSGNVVKKVDILDEALAIAAILNNNGPGRVWISTSTGKIHILGEEGTLVGLLQSPGLPIALHLYPAPPEAGPILFSSGYGKDVTVWDTKQFSVQRTFVGRTAGEVITDVVCLDHECSLVAVSSTKSLRLWVRQQGNIVFEIDDSEVLCLCADYSFTPHPFNDNPDSGIVGGYLWVAQRSTVTVFAVVAFRDASSTMSKIQLVKERDLPCPNTCQLLRTTPHHITAIDCEGQVSVWSVRDFGPVRAFKANSFICSQIEMFKKESEGFSSLNCSFGIVPTAMRATRLCWTFGPGDKVLLWSDESAINGGLMASDDVAALPFTNGESKQVSDNKQSSGIAKDMEKEEITFLRRKLKYMETMATLYRQKVGVLFREKGSAYLQHRASNDGDASRVINTFNEIDSAYADALERYEQQTLEQEPLPGYLRASDGLNGSVEQSPIAGQTVEDFVDYWKRKYQESKSDMQRLKDEYEGMMELFFLGGTGEKMSDDPQEVVLKSPKGRLVPMGSVSASLQSETDLKRAHHVCQLIREKNAVRERERQLLEDVERLRAKLREFNTPLASRGPLEDAETLKQQNSTLREEVKSLRAALDSSESQAQQLRSQAKQAALVKGRLLKLQQAVDEAEIKLSNRTAELQGDIDGILEKYYESQRIIEKQAVTVRNAQSSKHEAELQSIRKQRDIEELTEKVGDLVGQLNRQKSADDEVIDRLRDEILQLCDAVGDRETKVVEWQNKYEETATKLRDAEMSSSSLRFLVDSKESEISVLVERVAHLESIVQERKLYAQTISEVQGRIEMMIEELRHAFTPSEFAASIGKLEDRMANLIAVEQQLRHKDDIIAMKDDDIRLLKENAAELEAHISSISSVFLQLPHSVEEVEALLIEVDEYRRRLGIDTTVQAIVRQRLLDLYAKKKSNASISSLDTDLLLKTGMSYNDIHRNQPDKEALEKAKVLSESLKALASGVIRDNKIGLVGSTPSVPYSLHPVHGTLSECKV